MNEREYRNRVVFTLSMIAVWLMSLTFTTCQGLKGIEDQIELLRIVGI